MAKVRIPVIGTVGKSLSFDPNATVGATIGTDLKLPDGSIATKTTLAAYLGVSSAQQGVTQHRLLQGLTVGDDHPMYTRKDTLTARGDLYVRSATDVTRLAKGSTSQFLQAGATDPAWQTISPVLTLSTDLSGNATFTDLTSATLAATIVGHAVTNSKIRQSAGLSVIGNSTNATADVADITAASDAQVFRRSGSSIGFGAIDLSSTNAVSNRLAYANLTQGSALSVLGVTGNATADVASILASSDTTVLRRSGSAVAFGTIDHTYISDFSSAVPQPANPTASVKLTATNGSASTFMRSDGAPALDQSISPTWSGSHTFNNVPTLPSQSANKVFAGPTTGSAAAPAFRSLVDADIPTTLSLTTASSLVTVGTITSGTWSATAVSETHGGTNQTSYTLGDTLYASGSNTLAKLAGNITTTKKFLRQTGTGSVSAAPAWDTLVSGDIPNLGANPTASAGLTAVNGSATTYMRSDGAPALSQSISPTWTGQHRFTPSTSKTIFDGPSGDWAFSCLGFNSTGVSFGFEANAGTNSSDICARFRARAAVNDILLLRGDGRVSIGNSTDNAEVQFLGTGNLRFSGSTTGAQTATFSATNKPGSGTAGPIAWLPVLTAGGTQGYIPIFGA